ncbi:hypothetical protein NPS29_18820 [Pseudomonas putida]|uniref:hypothetical protein n=1 Tax=Pseudomonas putida TaxID=303 RepID=UPI00236484BB|nr:hypothetical protein [Pseudomonas putida]MDD1967386.1 hypothetical protein [Pseudomonas putida]
MTTCNSVHGAMTSARVQPELQASIHDNVMVHFNRLVERQGAMCTEMLGELHREWLGPRGLFATFGREIEQLGRQAPSLDELDDILDDLRLQQAESAVAFVLGQSHRRVAAKNPFAGRRREALCCVAFDDCAGLTLVERYAAYEALRQNDSTFFIKLIATTRGVSERRIVFRGLLEHYDSLMPLERCIYPEGYRSIQQGHLDREEALHGPLSLDGSLMKLLEKMTPLSLLKQVQPPSESLL